MLYNQLTKLPKEIIRNKIKEFIKEDSPNGDITAESSIDEKQVSSCNITAREAIVLSGIDIIDEFFDGKNDIVKNFKDGDQLQQGDIIATIKANTIEILRFERIILNLMQRMCGIATTTKAYVQIAEPFGVKILDTRKTTPGLRVFEKYSVVMGGGTNHRYDLSQGIMLKDNHLQAIGSITEAVKRMRNKYPSKVIEVEVDNFDQLKEVLKTDVDAILLDNFSPDETMSAVNYVRENQSKKLFIESSGGINLSNLKHYVNKGIDAISSGALTHSVKASDIGFDFI